MKQLLLQRYSYSETETEGRLWTDGEDYLYTLERPWIAGDDGGVPYESCVPDGEYELLPHVRPNGDHVYALRNPDLGVFYTREERGDRQGRFLILIHAGNYVDDVVGCIAPGLSRTIYNNRRMVTSSRDAMRKLMETKWASLLIEPYCGTG